MESSKTLESRLLLCDCNHELKQAIVAYMDSMQKYIQGVGNFVNIAYRGNLVYILSNINKTSLLQEVLNVTK